MKPEILSCRQCPADGKGPVTCGNRGLGGMKEARPGQARAGQENSLQVQG